MGLRDGSAGRRSERTRRRKRKLPGKTLIVDLDETIIYASKHKEIEGQLSVDVRVDDRFVTYQVAKRPYVDFFLEQIHPHYEIVIYTAGKEEYAQTVLDHIQIYPYIDQRFFRDDCIETKSGHYLKDLKRPGRDLSRVILMDDSAIAGSTYPDNFIPITAWYGDVDDTALLELLPLLLAITACRDVRHVLSLRHRLPQIPANVRLAFGSSGSEQRFLESHPSVSNLLQYSQATPSSLSSSSSSSSAQRPPLPMAGSPYPDGSSRLSLLRLSSALWSSFSFYLGHFFCGSVPGRSALPCKHVVPTAGNGQQLSSQRSTTYHIVVISKLPPIRSLEGTSSSTFFVLLSRCYYSLCSGLCLSLLSLLQLSQHICSMAPTFGRSLWEAAASSCLRITTILLPCDLRCRRPGRRRWRSHSAGRDTRRPVVEGVLANSIIIPFFIIVFVVAINAEWTTSAVMVLTGNIENPVAAAPSYTHMMRRPVTFLTGRCCNGTGNGNES